jgi:hypothetical protein
MEKQEQCSKTIILQREEKKMKKVLSAAVALGICLYLPVAALAGGGATSNESILRELQALRDQVSKQQAEIDMLKGQKVAAPVDLSAEQKRLDALEAKNWVSALKKKVDVTLYGQVSKAVMFADDGYTDDVFFVDNAISGTRLGVKAKSKLNEEFSVGGELEFEWTQNNSNKVSMEEDNFDGGNAEKRQMKVYGQSKSAGKLTLGHGSVAADGIAQIDLSGTSLSGRGDSAFGAGFLFYDNAASDYSGVTVGKIFTDLDGGRMDGLVYDSPAFFGVTLSGTVAEDNYNDVTVKYDHKFGDTQVKAGVAYTNEVEGSSSDNKLSGSASVMLPMGLNFTTAAGKNEFANTSYDDGTYWFGKVGYQMKALSLGSTSFAVDYGQYDDMTGATSLKTQYKGEMWGAEMLQKFDDINTEFFVAYRLYELDDNGVTITDYDNVSVILSGARFSF